MIERTAEEWGRVAVSLPGWRWMPGMRYHYGGFSAATGASENYVDRLWEDDAGPYDHAIFPAPDPNDPATFGCILELYSNSPGWHWVEVDAVEYGYRLCTWMGRGSPVVRGPLARNPSIAVIAAAEALGRWPGGAS